MKQSKCIFILSEKSSGSSILQRTLVDYAGARLVEKTRHAENETLYWTKAASVLSLEQISMVKSEVPLPKELARLELESFLDENLPNYTGQNNDREMIMQGWKQLCEHYSPILLEKSPHHLCQWSALKLMVEFCRKFPETEVMFIGLVRHPMDTIFSQYSRWGSPPRKVERQWITAYENLLKLKKLNNINIELVRYEDVLSSSVTLERIFEFCDAKVPVNLEKWHNNSIRKWKSDRLFMFSLSERSKRLASQFGYHSDLERPEAKFWWPVYQKTKFVRQKFASTIRQLSKR